MKLASLVLCVVAACGGGGERPPDAQITPTPDAAPPMIDADTGEVPRVEPAACRFDVDSSLGAEGTDYECGDLVVEENRENPTRHIRLHYVRFASPAAATHRASIYLDGGPGGDGQGILDYAAYLGPAFLDGLMVDGDFLVLGQRGTARSVPFLECLEPSCADFAGVADLPSYNTAYNADDVDDLRAALGFDALDVYGISYGSRLGLEVLRRHGDRVRAALIEGLVPSQVVWPAAIPASFHGALTALHQSCADAGACGAAFGNLVAKFLTGVDALNANPVTVVVDGNPVPLDGYTYAYLMFSIMYSRSVYAYLPLVINDLAIRRTDRIASLLSQLLGGDGFSGIAPGLYYGVVCGELYNPPDPDAFDEANAGVPQAFIDLYGGSYFSLLDTCASWPVGDLQAELAQPVGSSVRTFVSSGRLDPITPPSFGDIAALTLSDSVVVVHENSGHGATLQSPCGIQNLFDFIADPTAPHDTSCAAAITTEYVIPGALTAPPVPHARIRAELRLAPLPPYVLDRLRRARHWGLTRGEVTTAGGILDAATVLTRR
jgi:pimeloyl-ACP methyl ester carboxylesterase